METGAIVAGLYRSVLGAAWQELDEVVRRFHSDGCVVRAVGVFRILHGSNSFARFLTWAARMPAAAEAVPLQLVIAPTNHGEEWHRNFAGQALVSTQWKRADGLLAEAVGPLEIRFQLEVSSGALRYHTQSVAVRLGPICIPLPRWLSPCVSAEEKPAGQPEQVLVWIEATLPFLGRLIRYEGTVNVEASL